MASITQTLGLSLALALPAGSALARDGATLYVYCEQCHQSDGGGDTLSKAPNIAGLDAWYVEAQLTKFRNGARGAHAQDVDGLRMRPMARALVDEAEVKAVAEYVASLPRVAPVNTLSGGDASKGKGYFGTCQACHGANAEGNQAMSAPRLAGQSDWYLYSQLSKFKAGVRGSNPADTTGAMMAPMAATLPDEQAVKDVIAHIQSLPR